VNSCHQLSIFRFFNPSLKKSFKINQKYADYYPSTYDDIVIRENQHATDFEILFDNNFECAAESARTPLEAEMYFISTANHSHDFWDVSGYHDLRYTEYNDQYNWPHPLPSTQEVEDYRLKFYGAPSR
jgi:hypothetical protein